MGLFKKVDPICGMKEKKGTGIYDKDTKNWFCSEECKTKFYEKMKKANSKPMGCCH